MAVPGVEEDAAQVVVAVDIMAEAEGVTTTAPTGAEEEAEDRITLRLPLPNS